MFSISPKLEAGKWIDYPPMKGIRLKIRPRSMYSLNITPGENYSPTTKDIFGLFNYALVDWEGIGDEDGKKLACNDENKFALISQNDEFGAFVITESSKLREGNVTEQEAKNLKKSPSGETPKSEKPPAPTV